MLECQQPGDRAEAEGREQTQLIPWLLTFNLQNYEITHFCSFRPQAVVV